MNKVSFLISLAIQPPMPALEQIERPYRHLWWSNLRRIFEQNHDDLKTLCLLLIELSYRNSKPAHELRSDVLHRTTELVRSSINESTSINWPKQSHFGAQSHFNIINGKASHQCSHLCP